MIQKQDCPQKDEPAFFISNEEYNRLYITKSERGELAYVVVMLYNEVEISNRLF